jgi:hypothetical protein
MPSLLSQAFNRRKNDSSFTLAILHGLLDAAKELVSVRDYML